MGLASVWETVRWGLTRTVRNYRDPEWWRIAIWNRIRNGLLHTQYRLMAPEGVDIMEADWDNLFIVDGCRYDMFEDLNCLPGRLSWRYSKATATPEFLERNFAGTQHHDTVYVTANPMYRREEVDIDWSGVFFDIVDIWAEGWDEELNTVRPEVVAEAVEQAHETYPEKRILAHFVQPHHPFIGEEGGSLKDTGMQGTRTADGESATDEKIWDRLRNGEVDVNRVEKAYRENLELLFPHLETLLESVTGRTVITSDHGNLLGERLSPFPFREYGHPSDVYAEGLLRVPWLVIEKEPRKQVVAMSPESAGPREMTEGVQRRLAELGYLQE